MENNKFVAIAIFWATVLTLSVFYSTKGHAKVSFEQAKAVFSRIQNAAGTHTMLFLDSSSDVNAHATPYAIHINQGLLDFCDTPAEVALVLGHEITHFIHRDAAQVYGNAQQELTADKEGYYYTVKSGFKNSLRFMKKCRKAFGDGGDEVHPSWSYRLKHVKGGN